MITKQYIQDLLQKTFEEKLLNTEDPYYKKNIVKVRVTLKQQTFYYGEEDEIGHDEDTLTVEIQHANKNGKPGNWKQYNLL